MKKSPTFIKVTAAHITSLEFIKEQIIHLERFTGKRFPITQMIGELRASERYGFSLVVEEINEAFDALDGDRKVQIKARWYKRDDKDRRNNTAMVGNLMSKDKEVKYDYALLVLLDNNYDIEAEHFVAGDIIKAKLDTINSTRKETKRSLSIGQFIKLASENPFPHKPVSISVLENSNLTST